MARKKLERIEATEGSTFAPMTEEQLLLDGSQGAKDEIFRRRFNKRIVKKQA
jgi:hypothetical protein